MRITAMYNENGKLELPSHIKTKHGSIKVVVDIPEEELEVEEYLESIENEDVRRMMYRLRKIRGGGPVVSAEDKSDRELLTDAFTRMRQEGEL
jgi:hypothetical protein